MHLYIFVIYIQDKSCEKSFKVANVYCSPAAAALNSKPGTLVQGAAAHLLCDDPTFLRALGFQKSIVPSLGFRGLGFRGLRFRV